MRHEIIEEDLQGIASAHLPWEELAGTTVLVSGAAGFLPAYMVEALLYRNEVDPSFGVRVIALVRDLERAQSRFAHYLGRDDLQFLTQDVCEPISLSVAPQVIIHAASPASPRYFGVDPIGTLLPNTVGTYRLLELARRSRSRRFLFISSGEVYGRLDNGAVPTPEDAYGSISPVDPRSCYAESKRMGEAMCVAWHVQEGVPTRIARPFHTYGPGMRMDDGRVFADFVADIVQRRDIVMKSDGAAKRAFCYLADATAGLFTVLLRGEAAQPYNVGNQEAEVSVLELANILVDLFPERGLRVVRESRLAGGAYLESPIPRNVPDTTRLRALGWAPTTSIRAGFSRTVRSYE
jgi:UDP-glucuronate decarboxylase